jgi:hypothetical protein
VSWTRTNISTTLYTLSKLESNGNNIWRHVRVPVVVSHRERTNAINSHSYSTRRTKGAFEFDVDYNIASSRRLMSHRRKRLDEDIQRYSFT